MQHDSAHLVLSAAAVRFATAAAGVCGICAVGSHRTPSTGRTVAHCAVTVLVVGGRGGETHVAGGVTKQAVTVENAVVCVSGGR